MEILNLEQLVLIRVYTVQSRPTLFSHHAAYIWAGGHLGHVTRMP